MERHISAHFDVGTPFYVENDDEQCEAIEPFKVEQFDLLPCICPIRAVTHEATVAKAGMLHLWAADLIEEIDAADWVGQMTAGIMRDLLAMEQIAGV